MNLAYKFKVFVELFFDKEGWKRVVFVGLRNTLVIAILGLAIGIVIGTLIAVVRVMPKYKRLPKILDGICTVYVGFFRGTPIVVQLLISYYVLFPLMNLSIDSLTTCIIVFGLNSGAYVSEVMRGGINSVDPGQLEAGRAVGLPYWTAMIKIVIPQSIKNILPTLGNEFIALVKDTSVVSFVAAVDLYKTFTEIGNVRYEYLVPYLAMAVVYIVLVMVISLGVKLLERRLKRNERVAK
jgi:polar amino acid transport system permease protein